MKYLLLIFLLACNTAKKQQKPEIRIESYSPDIIVQDLDVPFLLRYADSLNQIKLDSAEFIIIELKKDMEEMRLKHINELQEQQNDFDKQRANRK